MTVPPPTEAPAPAAFGVPEGFTQTVQIGKPNWIQDAEAIAKADITRLEGKLKRVCGSVTGTFALSLTALLVSCVALFRACH